MTQPPPTSDAVLAGMPALDWLEHTYVDLHRNPELSHLEHRSARIVSAKLRALGYEVTEGIGGTGVVGVLGNGDGPTVLFRADMDALPVQEDTGLPYASAARGLDRDGVEHPVMHACGHDFHMTWLMAAAELLAQGREHWSGTFVALFQPAEETGDGARGMVADGLVDLVPRPDVVIGQHVNARRAGQLQIRSGPALSRSEQLEVVIHGRGGHGSSPHYTIDPIVVAASIVTRLQTVVARELSPFEFGVVTVGMIHAGTKANIIPATAELHLNLRSYDDAVHDRIVAAVRRIANAEAAAAGCLVEPSIRSYDLVPATVNDPVVTERVREALTAVGLDVVECEQIAGSEDFSELPNAWGVPYAYWFVGGWDAAAYDAAEASDALLEIPSNHSPFFAPVMHPTLEAGVRSAVASSLAFLGAPAVTP